MFACNPDYDMQCNADHAPSYVHAAKAEFLIILENVWLLIVHIYI